jgi:hypothetical protein
MDNKPSQNLEQFLDRQLERTNYWLSFAEAKNAALLAFNIAVIAFVADFQKDLPVMSTLVMFVFIIASLVCLRSFLPNDTSRPDPGPKYLSTDNLLFWKDIAYIEDDKKYLTRVIEQYYPATTANDLERKMLLDFSSEIVINSRIALAKYNLFTWALRIDFIAFLLSVVMLMLA